MQYQLVINENKQKIEKLLSYPILCSLCHLHQRNQIKMKFTQLRNYFNVVYQVHIIEEKASTKRGHLIAQFHNTEVKWSINPCIVLTKKVIKALWQKAVEWIMKNSNVRVYIVSSPSKKTDKKKFTQLRIYFNVAGQVHIFQKKASTKRGHLIAQFHNTAVKWSIKPCIFWTKKLAR